MLYGNVPVKKKGWKAGVEPLGEVSGSKGMAWLDIPGEQSPRLRGMAAEHTGLLGTPGVAHAEAAVTVGMGGGPAAASGAGKASSLLHDVGVQMLSA